MNKKEKYVIEFFDCGDFVTTKVGFKCEHKNIINAINKFCGLQGLSTDQIVSATHIASE